MKKGVLFTFGITLVMLIILTFAVLIYKNSLQASERTAEIGVLDRVFDIDTSVQESLKELFTLKSGIILTKNNLTVSIKEDLPNGNSAAFEADMEDFKEFVESKFDDNPKVKLNITKITEELPLDIKPNNIKYTHPKDFGNKQIRVIPEELNVKSYGFTFEINAQTYTSYNWDVLNTCTTGDSCVNFTFVVKKGGVVKASDTKNVDMSKSNKLTIKLQQGDITIDINNPAIISIDNGANAVNLISSIEMRNVLNYERIKVMYPENVIELNLKELQINKKSTARIL